MIETLHCRFLLVQHQDAN